jgi:hypothetical protein
VQDHGLPLVRREPPERAEHVDEWLTQLAAVVPRPVALPALEPSAPRRDLEGAPPEPPTRRIDCLASREQLCEGLDFDSNVSPSWVVDDIDLVVVT